MFMRFNLGLLISEDMSDKNPLVRFADISRSYQDIIACNENSSTLAIAPGDTANVVINTRALTADVTTQFSISFPVATSSVARLSWANVGAPPGFRTARALGTDATTNVSVTRLAPSIVRFATVSGTAFSTLQVQVGDFLRLERSTDAFASQFAPTNQGVTFPVVGVGATTFDVQDNGLMVSETGVVLASNFATQMKVLTSGPVRIGDTIIVDGIVGITNVGQYKIIQVSDNYVEYIAPQAYPQVFTNGANLVKVYSHLIGFLNIRSNGPLTLSIDGGQAFNMGMISARDGIFVGSVRAYQVTATNNTLGPVYVTFQYASLVG